MLQKIGRSSTQTNFGSGISSSGSGSGNTSDGEDKKAHKRRRSLSKLTLPGLASKFSPVGSPTQERAAPTKLHSSDGGVFEVSSASPVIPDKKSRRRSMNMAHSSLKMEDLLAAEAKAEAKEI
jgi:hypothetical protein